MHYRSEVDGLRALAIVPVILFHAGFSLFSGGYLGVDVFFVISGFLITSLIHDQIVAKTFSFRVFYERRARRLFPALFVVAIASIPFAWAWVPPDEFIEYSQSLIAVALFIANIFFYAQSGYFDTAAELKPFLHTWSLAIEEQYYFLFPVVLMLLLKLLRKSAFVLLLGIAGASYFASQAVIENQPSAAFFHLHLRVWELMVGSTVALWAGNQHQVVRRMPVLLKDGLAGLGLVAILISIFTLDESTRHPGAWTWVPVLGTALVLLFSSSNGLTGKLLGWRPFVSIGLLSYGAYLWHQPIFALVRQRNFSEPTTFGAIALIALTFILAAASLRFIERPIRTGRVLPGKHIFTFWGVGTLVLLIAGGIGMEKDGWSGRFNLPDEVSKSLVDRSPRGKCDPYTDANGLGSSFCWLGADYFNATNKIAVFGDSHAYPITAAFDEPARELGVSVVMSGIGGCLPLLGANVIDGPNPFSSCSALAERQVKLVKDMKIEKVFLISRWSLYTSRGYTETKMYHVGASIDDRRTLDHSLHSFEAALNETAKAYEAAGAKVFIVSQVPQQITHPFSAYYKIFADGFQGHRQAALDFASIDLKRHLSIQKANRDIIERSVKANPSLTHAVLDSIYCGSSICRLGTPEHSYYTDTNHISTDGALLAKHAIRELISGEIKN